MIKKHIPVLAKEIIEFVPSSSQIIIDWTLWHWWHTELFCKNFPQSKIIGFDIDPEILQKAKDFLKDFSNVEFVNNSYTEIKNYLTDKNIKADFVLLDLWINREHVLNPQRWFSFQKDWPLDMRFSNNWPTAYQILQQIHPEKLIDNLINYWDFGPKRAQTIAYHISKNKRKKLLHTTLWLKKLLSNISISKKELTLVFQTLRIMTNKELDNIENFLLDLWNILSKNWICCIISYHSWEDRLVKNYFKKYQSTWNFQILTNKPIIPSNNEIKYNKASRSAKLRIIKKISD